MNKLRFNGEVEQWIENKIDNVLTLHYGKDQKGFEDENGDYPIIGTGGEIGRTNTPLFKGESVLIGRKGTIDKPKYINGGFRTIDTMFYTQMKDNVSATYIHQLFTSIPWRKYNEATGVPSLSSKVILNVSIPLPSLSEQSKIGGFLSALDEQLDIQSELVDLLALEYTGYSQQIFTQKLRFKDENGQDYPEWEQKKLIDTVTLVGGGTPSTDDPSYWGGDHQWFTPAEIKSRYVTESLRTISDEGLAKSSARLLPAGAVILTTRATLGNMAILMNEATTNQGFQNLIPNNNIITDYLLALQPLIKEYCIKKSSGTTFKEISKKELSKMIIPLPSLPEQKKIGGFLSALSARLEKERELLTQLREQKKAYLQKLLP